MITRRTKIQLVIFVIITLFGVTYVGARYAQLDRLIRDDSYTVQVQLADSGGIFSSAAVTYRGVTIGRVGELVLTDDGVDAYLEIENKWDDIPADATALVGNKSAVGEQYLELQPQSDVKPYLVDGSTIDLADTSIPIPTETLLANITTTVESVDRDALRTSVLELGKAFGGTGEDLQRLIDTGDSFLEAADANFDVTTKLIADGNTVLDGQIASESGLRTFASQLSLFTDTLADADPDLRAIIDDGSFAANQLRGFIEDNRIELGELINNLVTTGEVFVKRLPGIQQVFSIYPYVVEGGFTVVSKSPDTGLYDAHFGMIINDSMPCTRGYEGTDRRSPTEGSNAPMNEDARCTEPATESNARGSQNAPPRAAADYEAPVVASYDPETRQLTWGDRVDPALTSPGTVAPRSLGEESWKWLYLQPMMAR